jgi:acid phosphatase type 7
MSATLLSNGMPRRAVLALVPLLAVVVSVGACPESGAPARPSQSSSSPPAPGPPGSTPSPPIADPGPSGGPDVIFAGAGDIAVCGSSGAEETARLLDALPGIVFTTGDNVYYSGTAQQFRDCYEPTWGRHKRRTRPSPGNHDYETPGARDYFDYFGLNAGPPGLGYYAYRAGGWEVFSLNSNIPTDASSAQYQWLRSELAARPAACSAAYFHHPVVSEGTAGDARHMRAIWELLFAHGVDVVLAGHDHNYQRFARLDGAMRRDPLRGMRQFIVGTGGASNYPLPAAGPNTEARVAAWGVLKLTLRPSAYEWEFVPVANGTFRDMGREACH